jgi:uncharacterized protein YqiB (DUF1249 family)
MSFKSHQQNLFLIIYIAFLISVWIRSMALWLTDDELENMRREVVVAQSGYYSALERMRNTTEFLRYGKMRYCWDVNWKLSKTILEHHRYTIVLGVLMNWRVVCRWMIEPMDVCRANYSQLAGMLGDCPVLNRLKKVKTIRLLKCVAL